MKNLADLADLAVLADKCPTMFLPLLIMLAFRFGLFVSIFSSRFGLWSINARMVTTSDFDGCQHGHYFRFRLVPAWSPIQVQSVASMVTTSGSDYNASMVTASGSDWYQHGYRFRFRLVPEWSPIQVQTVASMVTTSGSDCCQHGQNFRFILLPA